MQIFMFRPDSGETNFGDELNMWLFPKLFSRNPKTDDTTLFVGIGTYLRQEIPKFERTIIFGAGAGYGNIPVDTKGWEFYFVRGPKTAEAMHLPREFAITDPAILTAEFIDTVPSEQRDLSAFMPHWIEAQRDPGLQSAVERIGIRWIDPRWPVPLVLKNIKSSRILYTSALHGAIVADSLRVPWTPVWSNDEHNFKWEDWTESMELDYRPIRTIEVGRLPVDSLRLSSDKVFKDRLHKVMEQVNIVRKAL